MNVVWIVLVKSAAERYRAPADVEARQYHSTPERISSRRFTQNRNASKCQNIFITEICISRPKDRLSIHQNHNLQMSGARNIYFRILPTDEMVSPFSIEGITWALGERAEIIRLRLCWIYSIFVSVSSTTVPIVRLLNTMQSVRGTLALRSMCHHQAFAQANSIDIIMIDWSN